MIKKKPVVLCILDGWGKSADASIPDVLEGTSPYLDKLMLDYPTSFLEASGLEVGLPKDQMGNSEVGHMNLGAGRIVMQDLPRIDEAIAQNKLKELPEFVNFINKLKISGGTCHLMGILSDGGIHGHIAHLIELIKILDKNSIPVMIHGFLDGRDTPPKSALIYIKKIEEMIQKCSSVRLGTLMGRYYAMDRDNRWDRIQKAYDAIIHGKAKKVVSFQEAISNFYLEETTDEFILPLKGEFYQGVQDQDGLLSFNYRSDRIRQILRAFLCPHFDEFQSSKKPLWSATLAMVDYADDLTPFLPSLFKPLSLEHGLGEIISAHGLKQMRIAETEKYAHVTFFFNGGREHPFPGEDRCLVPSPKVTTYDLQPEMSLPQVMNEFMKSVNRNIYDFILVNFANPDMVGHSGNIDAARLAMQYVDSAIQRLTEIVLALDGVLAITADHGNIEIMFDPVTKQPHTAHTMNPVPFILVTKLKTALSLRKTGKLCDVAPTLLPFLGLKQPANMRGVSLLLDQGNQ